MNASVKIPSPVGLLAELTHRCPLGCPYCSNPLEMDARDGELDTATWNRLFSQAAKAGVLQVHLSGGEPVSRRDIVELVAHSSTSRPPNIHQPERRVIQARAKARKPRR